MSKRVLRSLIFALSGAVAYELAFWEALWPLARYVAGWYAILVIVAVLAAGVITLSIKWGPVQYRPGLLDYFILW